MYRTDGNANKHNSGNISTGNATHIQIKSLGSESLAVDFHQLFLSQLEKVYKSRLDLSYCWLLIKPLFLFAYAGLK